VDSEDEASDFQLAGLKNDGWGLHHRQQFVRQLDAVQARIDELKFGPARLCCFQRHYGPQCPDGKVMCCLCFNRFDVSELHITGDGRPEDVCKACASAEMEHCPIGGA
jgi:hypothetical protein